MQSIVFTSCLGVALLFPGSSAANMEENSHPVVEPLDLEQALPALLQNWNSEEEKQRREVFAIVDKLSEQAPRRALDLIWEHRKVSKTEGDEAALSQLYDHLAQRVVREQLPSNSARQQIPDTRIENTLGSVDVYFVPSLKFAAEWEVYLRPKSFLEGQTQMLVNFGVLDPATFEVVYLRKEVLIEKGRLSFVGSFSRFYWANDGTSFLVESFDEGRADQAHRFVFFRRATPIAPPKAQSPVPQVLQSVDTVE